ncbi:hypothetical protein WN943_009178 [Citrus x changshan-huyou]
MKLTILRQNCLSGNQATVLSILSKYSANNIQGTKVILTGSAPPFESQGSRLCWENLYLSVRAGTSSMGCGTDLKVSPTVEALLRITRGTCSRLEFRFPFENPSLQLL